MPSDNIPAIFPVFTVGLSAEAVSAVRDACTCVNDAEFAAEIPNYLTRGKRPPLPATVRDAPVALCVIGIDGDMALAAESMEVLRLAMPGRLAIAALSSRTDPATVLEAMRAGCSEFFSQPLDPLEFADAVLRIQHRFTPAMQTISSIGEILSFFSVKGGAGATTLSVYLATFLVRVHRKKVLLIDHHHQLGHTCLYLGIKENPYYFDELLRNASRLDHELLQGFLTKHPCGLDVLASPDTCAQRYVPGPGEMEHVLDFLRTEYEYVLLDSSLDYHDDTPVTVEASSQVFLVATPDVASLRDLSRHVENFGLENTAASKVRVALNRASSQDAVTPEQVESAVRFPVTVTIPNNYMDLMRAVNAGEPISPQRRSAFTTQIAKWANSITQSAVTTEKRNSRRKSLAFWK
jgi:pilus assembly protein CpaE